MKSIFVFFLLISCTQSCTHKNQEQNKSVINYANTSPDLLQGVDDWFPDHWAQQKEEDSLESIVLRAKSNLGKNSSHNAREKELEAVYYRDQIFRDSIHLPSTNLNKSRFGKKFKQSDKVNQRVILAMFDEIGWIDTREMSQKASEAILLTIIHCNDDVDFNKVAFKHLQQAFKEDSIISNSAYATAADRIYNRLEGKSMYGTHAFFGIKKEFDSVEVRAFNSQRKLIGLNNYLEEDGYY